MMNGSHSAGASQHDRVLFLDATLCRKRNKLSRTIPPTPPAHLSIDDVFGLVPSVVPYLPRGYSHDVVGSERGVRGGRWS